MKLRYKIGASLIILTGFFLFWKKQHQTDQNTASVILSPDAKEKIIIDPNSHKIKVVTVNGVDVRYLPGMRPSSVEVKKDGSVIVLTPQYGFEHGLFGGGGFSNDGLRFALGLDLFYYKRFDIGLFLSDSTKDLTKVRTGVQLSYNFWHDLRLGFGIDHNTILNAFLTERF